MKFVTPIFGIKEKKRQKIKKQEEKKKIQHMESTTWEAKIKKNKNEYLFGLVEVSRQVSSRDGIVYQAKFSYITSMIVDTIYGHCVYVLESVPESPKQQFLHEFHCLMQYSLCKK